MEITRRQLLAGSLATSVAAFAPKLFASVAPKESRALSFLHTHTAEKLAVTYWEQGQYIKGALDEINHLLRDHRTDDVAQMDATLMDILYLMHHETGSSEPFQVISAYRSPKTNHMLANRSGGVARKSYHLQGRAIDIRLKDRDTRDVQKIALSLKAGGVGLYTGSDFVHLDTGPVRQWGR